MKGIFTKLAWRNVFRNKRRTLIAGSAIGIGLAAMIFADAMMLGMEQNMTDSATGSFMGEGQIHQAQYRESHDVENTIRNLADVTARLDQDKQVRHYTQRTMAFGMLGSPSDAEAVQMVGINPETERNLSEVDEVMVEGAYLDDTNERDIIIGKKLAELLEVGLGDRVVLTTAQAHTGDLSQEMFRVSGIFHFNIREMDSYLAFVSIKRAQQMLGLPGEVHEIAVSLTDPKIGRNPNSPFWKRYTNDGNEAVGWATLMPQLVQAFEMTEFSKWIIGLILFAIVALVIINSLFMSLYERMFEFGVLRAVGTRPMSLGRLVVLEAGALSILAIVMGLILSAVILWIVSHYGIDYGGIEYAGVTFRKLLYPVAQLRQFLLYPFCTLLFTMIIAMYPGGYAARLTPAHAMRKSF